MVTRYRLTAPIPAICHPPAGAEIAERQVTLPACAVLFETVEHSGTITGMIGVYWEGRHYSIFLRDLLQKTERVANA
jgi:hypothetical protein